MSEKNGDETIILIDEQKDFSLFTEKAEQQKSDLIGEIYSSEKEEISQPRNASLILEGLTSKESFWHVSISPDGNHVLVFNHETRKIKISSFENLENTKAYDISDVFKNDPEKIEKIINDNPKWMLAISNCIKHEGNEFFFVAISYVTESDMLYKDQEGEKNHEDHFSDEQSEKEEIMEVKEEEEAVDRKAKKNGKTVIFKATWNQINSENNLEKHYTAGGIVVFVHDKEKVYCLIFNVNGIHRKSLTHDDNSEEIFDYPKRLKTEIESLYKNKTCTVRLHNSIFYHYFFIEQYKEGVQVLQLYDLKTMEIEQMFDMHDKKNQEKKFGTPIFAISKSDRIMAFSSELGKLKLYLKENGLEIASKDFGEDVKILFCDFIKNDETLMVIIQELGCKTEKILFWDLFSTSENKIIEKDIKFKMDEEITSSIARVPGKFIVINTDGEVYSIFDKLIDYFKVEEKDLEHYSIVIHSDLKKVGTPNEMPSSKSKIKKSGDHIIYHQIKHPEEETYPHVNNKEPWVLEDYKRISAYLDEEEKTQLFIGSSTIQVWRKYDEKKIVLEYIWTNNVDKDKEREDQSKLEVLELYVGNLSFSLKVKWKGLDGDPVEIKWPYSDNHVTPIKHACDALEHLNYRREKLVGYKKQHKFEEIKKHISYIIWRFIKNKPDMWRLIDVRYDVMAKIIISGSHTLVKYILFGDEKKKNRYLHVPRIHRWDERDERDDRKPNKPNYRNRKIDMKLSDLQIAIRLCKAGLERNRRILIVAYLLEYYTKNSLHHIGWLSTVSKAFPDLYKSELDSYAKELFYKRCISGLEISNIIEFTDFTPKIIQGTLTVSHKFRAFNPISKLIPKNEPDIFEAIRLFLANIYANIFSKYENSTPIIKIIPLYEFTVSDIKKNDQNDLPLVKILKYIFIPRRYLEDKVVSKKDDKKDDKKSRLSPFVQIIRSEEDDDIFDNPAMEAAIDYKWRPARNYFLQIFLRYILYAASFAGLGGTYVAHFEATGLVRNFLIFLFVLFYYSGGYFLLVEYYQFHHRHRNYLEFFNIMDLGSIIASLVIMSVYIAPSFKLSNAFGDAQTTQDATAAVSFTMLILWFEIILYLRLLREPAKYIYIILNIIKKTYFFVGFMLLVVLALSHAFLLLLQHPDFTNLTPKITSSTLTNSITGEPTGNKVTQDFDIIQDNPSKDFITSFLTTYAWLRGSYAQIDTWNFWAVEVLTLIAGLFLITVIQNIFIAFIWGVYAEAYEKGRVALLRFRADLISDYEALDDVQFYPQTPEPKYICYLGKSRSYDAWNKAVKEHRKEKGKLYDYCEKKMNEKKLLFEEIKDEKENSLWHYKDDKDNGNVDYNSDEDSDGEDDDEEDYIKIKELLSKHFKKI